VLGSDQRSDRMALKIDRVRLAQPDHRLDMKMLLILTQICKCSLVLDLSNQSGRIGWLRQPEYHVSLDM